jgi:DNA-binding cell septation regulator SpoVG
MISVLNFKRFERGSILGFFDLRYHGLAIKGCRLMTGQNGLWVAFPQKEGKDENGAAKYYDQLFLSKPEMEHIRNLVIAELQMQGLIQFAESPQQHRPHPMPEKREPLSEYMAPTEDDIPF